MTNTLLLLPVKPPNLNTRHFALEEYGEEIAWRILAFIRQRAKTSNTQP